MIPSLPCLVDIKTIWLNCYVNCINWIEVIQLNPFVGSYPVGEHNFYDDIDVTQVFYWRVHYSEAVNFLSNIFAYLTIYYLSLNRTFFIRNLTDNDFRIVELNLKWSYNHIFCMIAWFKKSNTFKIEICCSRVEGMSKETMNFAYEDLSQLAL